MKPSDDFFIPNFSRNCLLLDSHVLLHVKHVWLSYCANCNFLNFAYKSFQWSKSILWKSAENLFSCCGFGLVVWFLNPRLLLLSRSCEKVSWYTQLKEFSLRQRMKVWDERQSFLPTHLEETWYLEPYSDQGVGSLVPCGADDTTVVVKASRLDRREGKIKWIFTELYNKLN